jgi:hypothetical protein
VPRLGLEPKSVATQHIESERFKEAAELASSSACTNPTVQALLTLIASLPAGDQQAIAEGISKESELVR